MDLVLLSYNNDDIGDLTEDDFVFSLNEYESTEGSTWNGLYINILALRERYPLTPNPQGPEDYIYGYTPISGGVELGRMYQSDIPINFTTEIYNDEEEMSITCTQGFTTFELRLFKNPAADDNGAMGDLEYTHVSVQSDGTVGGRYIEGDFYFAPDVLSFDKLEETVLCTLDGGGSSSGGAALDTEAVSALINTILNARFNNNNGTLAPNDDHLKFDDKVTSPVTSATLDDCGYYNVTYAPGTGVGSTS